MDIRVGDFERRLFFGGYHPNSAQGRRWLAWYADCRRAAAITELKRNPHKHRRDGELDLPNLQLYMVVLERIDLMAGKPKKAISDAAWKGFVECRLTDTQKEAFRHWDLDGNDAFDLVVTSVQTGHKLSLSYNRANDNFVASLTCTDMTSPNGGYTLSAFAPDLWTALRLVVFKHEVVLERRWENKSSPSSDIG